MFETKLQKSLLGLATAGLMAIGLASAASAGPINLGGVRFNAGDNLVATNITENRLNPAGGLGQVVSGFGQVGLIGGVNDFCAIAGCELVFDFGGYALTSIIPGFTDTVTFSGGWLNVYTQNAGTLAGGGGVGTDASAALWLSLTAVARGDAGLPAGTTLVGTVSDFGGPNETVLTAGNLLEVNTAGMIGLANGNFDTNTFLGALGVSADVKFGASTDTTTAPTGFLTGSADLRGNVIPEPASLALLGFGLIGVGAMARRRRRRA